MFDPSAPHIIILIVVVLLLFGSKRLPGAARSLGQSMHIFKKSVAGLTEDENEAGTGTANAAGTPLVTTVQPDAPIAPPSRTAARDHQAQIQDLHRQLQNLQQQPAVNGNSAHSSEVF
jgi:sec-independent protein translocase protein TatA